MFGRSTKVFDSGTTATSGITAAVVHGILIPVAVSVAVLVFVSWRQNDLDDEVIFGVVGAGLLMTLLTGVALAVVVWPIMNALWAVSHRADDVWIFGLAGAATLPLAALVFAVGTGAMPGSGGRPFFERLAFLLTNPVFAPILLGLGCGGMVFGIGFARGRRLLPANDQG